jgi:hypothetical protein
LLPDFSYFTTTEWGAFVSHWPTVAALTPVQNNGMNPGLRERERERAKRGGGRLTFDRLMVIEFTKHALRHVLDCAGHVYYDKFTTAHLFLVHA